LLRRSQGKAKQQKEGVKTSKEKDNEDEKKTLKLKKNRRRG
jgi:hypothetical protein